MKMKILDLSLHICSYAYSMTEDLKCVKIIEWHLVILNRNLTLSVKEKIVFSSS